jgi:hypothetical protein
MSRVRKTVVKKWLLGRAYGFLVFQGVGIPPYRGWGGQPKPSPWFDHRSEEGRRIALELSDVSLNFPGSNLCPVQVPLAMFLAQVILIQRLTKRLPNELTVLHLLQRFRQGFG